jgi:hypothetical protein
MLSLYVPRMSVHSPPRLHFELIKLLNYDINLDPNPAFLSNGDLDPDPACKINADPSGYGYEGQRFSLAVGIFSCGRNGFEHGFFKAL